MITSYQKFRIEDQSKNGKELHIEVNWDEKEETKDCKMLRLTYPDGQIAFVKRDHLMTMLFAIGRPEDQRDLVPYKLQHSRWYETVVSVKAKKNIQKGESLTFPLKITLPSVEEEVIGPVKPSSGLIIPKNVI